MNTTPLVPRIEDMPYHTSLPIQFTYKSSATFLAGQYTWADKPLPLLTSRPLMVNSLYYFRSISMAADIDETDFTANINVSPAFQMYLKSRAEVIMFREPVLMLKYLQNFDYRLAWFTHSDNDRLLASFNGILNQNVNLVGKSPISLTALISAQEITDEVFIDLFKRNFPTSK